MNKHLHSDDLTMLRENSMRSVNDIQFSFNSILSKNIYAFNHLIRKVSLQPVEIYNLLNENIVVNVNEKNLEKIDLVDSGGLFK